VQAVALPRLYDPPTQLEHASDALVQNVPGAHAVQAVEFIAVVNDPAVHEAHAVADEPLAKVPAEQPWHGTMVLPVNEPGKHATHWDETAELQDPALQEAHAVALAALYCPARQFWHGVEALLVKVPGVHCVQVEAPDKLNEPELHPRQTGLEILALYWPLGQLWHAADVDGVNRPGPHATQAEKPEKLYWPDAHGEHGTVGLPDAAPDEQLKFPQRPELFCGAYVPAEQFWQSDPAELSVSEVPTGQTYSEQGPADPGGT